jgi:hypothetical protein
MGQSVFSPSVTMNNVPFRTEVNISAQSDTEITPIKERKRICGVGEELKRYISFVFTGAMVMYTAISLCTLLAKLRVERCFVCMCLPAYEVEKEMREM